ncbi:OLC1v1025656C1 [Oldenlandia corymbosa var. corymbosa]|uniref:OLC1v1025656C1 n=1 Tax=Oldenlandia corymbosa var. corymbosa TaxID=529605 RepID=A0AAV1C5X9_OLDCO|nr:OLC1v1025656C1 [Oldenlandia corymbosa var. corymbosa]
MGFSISSNGDSSSNHHTLKIFLLCNYIILGAASSCIFLTLSLRLVPSLCGFFLILLHILTIVGAISGCAAASSGAGKWYGAHMYYAYMDGDNNGGGVSGLKRSAKVQNQEDLKDWPWPFQV